MSLTLPSGYSFPPRLVSKVAFDVVSVASSGTATSPWFIASYARSARVVIPSSGGNVAVSLEALHGDSWFELASYSEGVTGPQAIVDLLDPKVRLVASNSALSSQSVTAYLVFGM
jgi:hypothetical protein